MYVRPPSSRVNTVKLPENYSGNAFSRQAIYSEMPPPTRTQAARQDIPQTEKPINLDRPPEEISDNFTLPTYNDLENTTAEPTEKPTAPASSIFSSLLPRGALSTHFPFGHGIGSEELLILAVMLLVFLSGSETGEMDSEFILLLGLLLFAG